MGREGEGGVEEDVRIFGLFNLDDIGVIYCFGEYWEGLYLRMVIISLVFGYVKFKSLIKKSLSLIKRC